MKFLLLCRPHNQPTFLQHSPTLCHLHILLPVQASLPAASLPFNHLRSPPFSHLYNPLKYRQCLRRNNLFLIHPSSRASNQPLNLPQLPLEYRPHNLILILPLNRTRCRAVNHLRFLPLLPVDSLCASHRCSLTTHLPLNPAPSHRCYPPRFHLVCPRCSLLSNHPHSRAASHLSFLLHNHLTNLSIIRQYSL